MTESTAGRVKERLEDDPILTEAMRRGIVNQRALARWLIDTHDWDASEDSVVSGLRSYAPAEGEEAFAGARRVLKEAHQNTRSNLCSVQLSRRRDVEEGIPELFEKVNPTQDELIRLISSHRGFQVILDNPNLDLVGDVFGKERIEDIRTGLTELAIVLPSRGVKTPGVVALITRRLALREINIEGFVDGVDEEVFLVDDDDAIEAYEAISDLTGRIEKVEPP